MDHLYENLISLSTVAVLYNLKDSLDVSITVKILTNNGSFFP